MKLESILLFLTYRCNLRCGFCLSFNSYWRSEPTFKLPHAVSPELSLRPSNELGEMTTEQITERVIPQCVEAGVEVIALSGGEILARQDIGDIFDALGSAPLKWCFDSNAMLLNDQLAESVVRNGCDAVFVSIDGTQDMHNELRGSPKSFQKTTAGLRRLIAAKKKFGSSKPEIVVNYVLQPGNEAFPAEVVQLAVDEGIKNVTFQLLSQRQYTKAFNAALASASLKSASDLAGKYGVKVETYPMNKTEESHLRGWFTTPLPPTTFSGCEYITKSLRIDPQGYVIPCLEYQMGNVLTENLSDIWEGHNYKLFREHLNAKGPFQACLRCCNMTQAPQAEARPAETLVQ